MGGMITQLIGLNHPAPRPHPDSHHVHAQRQRRPRRHGGRGRRCDSLTANTAGPGRHRLQRRTRLGPTATLFSPTGSRCSTCMAGSGYPGRRHPRRRLRRGDRPRHQLPQHAQPRLRPSPSPRRWHDRLDQLDFPTLVIHGDEDPILPYDHGQALHAAIAGSNPTHARRVSATKSPEAPGTRSSPPSSSTRAERALQQRRLGVRAWQPITASE